jgi:hypothetical protein
MNSSANAGSLWITRVMSAFAIRTITHSVTADTVTRRCGCPVILEGLDGMLQSHEATGKAATVARPHQLDREHDGDGASRLSKCEAMAKCRHGAPPDDGKHDGSGQGLPPFENLQAVPNPQSCPCRSRDRTRRHQGD